jgi:hypothetical protein
MYPHPDDPATPVNELQRDISQVKASKAAGEPLVVDETFTLHAEAPDVMNFILSVRPEAAGYIGHYFERTPAELSPPTTEAEIDHRLFYQLFVALTPTVLDPIAAGGGIPTSSPVPSTTPQVVPGAVTVTEGNAGSTVALVPVRLSGTSALTVSASWATENLEAVTPGDFVAGSGTVSFAPGETAKTVGVTVNGDVLDEPDEALRVRFSNPQNATIDGAGAVVQATITDDDPSPAIAPGTVTVTEGNTGTKVALVPVRLSAPSGRTVSASWATESVQATSPADFVATSGTVSFAPGETAKTVGVTVKGDVVDEPNEAFRVRFSNPQNAVFGTAGAVGTATISDDDPATVILGRAASLAEGSSGTKILRVPVTLSAASGKTVTVRWATRNDQAIAPEDFVAASGTLTFSPGQTSKTVAVTIRGDKRREPNERFRVALTSPTNATIGATAALGSGTILNDD